MKKALFCMFALCICAGMFAQQPVVAVAPFDAISGVSAADANMITRVFFIRLGNTNKVSLVDRTVVERVIKEHNFQTGDWSNTKKTAELGSALNADWIVRGELEKFGTNILVTVQFYDIKTFRFMGGGDLRIANTDEAYDNMDPLVNKLVETIASTGTRTSGMTYNIGDTGPGGGIVFAAEGNSYMEVSRLLGDYTWDRAVQAAKEFRGGGYSDWYLPSQSEFQLMSSNLRKSGVNLGSGSYWTSSLQHASTGNKNDTDWYWVELFGGGLYTSDKKNATNLVRAVRQF